MVGHTYRCNRGGGLFIWNNILNKEWLEMCAMVYTPDSVTKKLNTWGHGRKENTFHLREGWPGAGAGHKGGSLHGGNQDWI